MQTTRGQYTPLYRIDGSLIKQMPPIDELAPLLFGDRQGDGRAEMFTVMDTFTHTVSSYGRMAQRDFSVDLGGRPQGLLLCNADGKRGQELLNMEVPDLVVYRPKGEPEHHSGWLNTIQPVLAADLDGDSVDEIIGVQSAMAAAKLLDPHYEPPAAKDDSRAELARADAEIRAQARPQGGFLNLKSGVFTEFQFPDLDYRGNVFNGRIEELGAADINGDGSLEILARPYLGTLLFAFDRQGQLVYHEEFGEGVTDMATGFSAGIRFVVLQTESRLLVWP